MNKSAEGNNSYRIRNYTSNDYGSYKNLQLEARPYSPVGLELSQEQYLGRMSIPGYEPVRDIFLVETGQKLVGFLNITKELAIGRVILECWINEAHRRQGLATKLLGAAQARIKEVDAGIIHFNVFNENIAAKAALRNWGYYPVRRFLLLRLKKDDYCHQVTCPKELKIRSFTKDDLKALTRLQNCCFSNHWGFCPNSEKELQHHISLPGFSPSNLLLCSVKNEMVAYCWMTSFENANNKLLGQILMLGVHPDYRKRHIARNLLSSGIEHLFASGMIATELTVDSENRNAYRLYYGLGFRRERTSLWFERKTG